MRIIVAICFIACCGISTISGQSLADRYSGTFDSLIIAARYEPALALAVNWEKSAQSEFGERSLERALALVKIATVKRSTERLSEADSLLGVAANIAESLDAVHTIVYADILSAISRVRQNQGKNEEAVAFIRKATDIKKDVLGPTDRRTIGSLNALSAALLRISANEEAAEILKNTITLCEEKKETNSTEYANLLQNYAKMLGATGRFNKAWSTFRDCLMLRKSISGDQSFEYWSTLFNYCSSLIAGGNLEALQPLLEEEKRLNKKLFSGGQTTNVLSSLQLRGAAQMSMRVYDEAIITFSEAKQVVVGMSKKESPFYANFCYNLGLAYDATYQFEKADTAFQEALIVQSKIAGKSSMNYLIYLLGRAQMLVRSGKTAESAALLNEVEPFFNEIQDNVYYYYFLQAKSDLALNQNQLAAGIAICDTALMSIPEKYGPYHDLISTFQEKKMTALFDNDQPREGMMVLDDYNKVVEYLFFTKYALLTDEERLKELEGYTFGLNMLANGAYQQPEIGAAARLMDMQLFAKNMLESTTRKILFNIQNTADPAVLSDYNNWEDAYEQLSDAYQNVSVSITNEDSLYLKNLEAEVAVWEKKLSAYGVAVIRNEEHTSWTDIRDALRTGECAIDVYRFPFRQKGWFTDTAIYAISIIKPGATRPELVFLENGNEIESFAAGQYQSEISRKKEVSAAVYEKMWAPVAAHLAGVSTLYFSPDGIFHKINLNTLRQPDGSYLVDQLTLVQVTNLRHLLHRTPDNTGLEPGTAVLFGNPAFGGGLVAEQAPATTDQNYRDILEEAGGNFKLTPLPGSKREVEQIGQKLSAKKWLPVIFTGTQATEDTLKKCKNPKVLHIATHGYFLNTEKRTDVTGFASAAAAKNPAMRSMLFFAGAENTLNGQAANRNDGILTAFEAAVLPLDGTELVVLSACNTGLGKIQNGEGVYGLQRAFRIAGAQSLIMSLWEVEDKATELFMNQFYQHWTSGMSKTAAFRKAQLALKAKYPQPFYWGSFVLVNG